MSLTGFDHNVQWHEFMEVEQRPLNTSEDAEILINFSPLFEYSAPPNQECRVTNVNTSITVNQASSWVVKDHKAAVLLSHEQGHYDITALGAREVHQRVSSIVVANCAEIHTEAQRIQQDVQTNIDAANIRYDSQTAHGTDTGAQTQWVNSIRSAKQSPTGTLSNLP